MRSAAGLLAFLSLFGVNSLRLENATPMVLSMSATESELEVDSPDSGDSNTGAQLQPAGEGSDALDFEYVEVFIQANSLYEEGKYEEAIGRYIEILNGGAAGGYVHFNLGNAYLRNGELGQAIASYLRSRRMLPREEDVKANLSFGRSSTKDAIDPPDPPALLQTLFFWHYGLSRAEVLRLLLVLNFLFWGTCVLRLFLGRSEILRWAFMVMLTLLVAVGASAAFSFLAPTRVAVVIPQEIEAHTGPSLDSVIRFKLHAGTETRIEDSREGWLRVALPTGEQGWIDGSGAEVVTDDRY